MDADQLEKIVTSLNRVATATLTATMINNLGRKPTLKDIQTIFNDCYMIVDPAVGTQQQSDFEQRINKKEW